jgi:Rnl2 family RNA ligase
MFLKYPSIIGEDDKQLQEFYERNRPELKDLDYIVTEKLHGANVYLYINKEGHKIYARSVEVTDGDFYGVQDIIKKHLKEDWLKTLVGYLDKTRVSSLRLYGEVYGKGVNKGVYYGEGRYIRWFDLELNDRSLSPMLMELYIPRDRRVPEIDYIKYDEIYTYQFLENSRLTPEGYDEENIAEGVVIRPFKTNIEIPRPQEDGSMGRSRFTLKRRNDAFFEAKRAKRPPLPDNILEWRTRFSEFITVNRALNMFSKAPLPESLSKAKAMIPLLVADAKEDFLKAYPTELDAFEKGERKSIFNAGNKPFNVIVEAYNSLLPELVLDTGEVIRYRPDTLRFKEGSADE